MRAVEITPLPKAPESVAGVLDFQGSVVPVFALRRRFGLPDREPRLDDQLILARTARRRVALVVDSVGGVVECAPGEMVRTETVLPGTAYVEGVMKSPDGLILIHDLDTFLSLDEERAIEVAMAS